MDIAILVFLVYLSLIGHEFSHMTTMLKKGAEVTEFGVGAPKGLRITYVPKTGRYAGVRFSFYVFTWMIGAFVDGEFNHLPYKDKALIVCAGPFANIIFGCLLLIAVFLMPLGLFEHTKVWGIKEYLMYYWYLAESSPYLWGSLITVPVLWFGRKFVSVYLAPVVAIILLVWVFRSVSSSGLVNYFSEFSGPVGLISALPDMTNDIPSVILLVAQISIVFGASNLLPIYPLDGGHLFLPAITSVSPRLAKIYKWVGMTFIISLVGLILAKDIILLVGYFGLIVVTIIALTAYFTKDICRATGLFPEYFGNKT